MTIQEAERIRKDYQFAPQLGLKCKKFIPVVTSTGETALIAKVAYERFMKNKKIEIISFEATEKGVLIKYKGIRSPVVGIVEFKDVSQILDEKKKGCRNG